MHFADEYAICKAEDILDFFMDHKIVMKLDAKELCTGCVFTGNIELLDNWVHKGTERFCEFKEMLNHEEFV